MFDNENKLDLAMIMKRYAQINMHFALPDISFLTDLPYDPEPDECEAVAAFGGIQPSPTCPASEPCDMPTQKSP
jgi:hypothetical protein